MQLKQQCNGDVEMSQYHLISTYQLKASKVEHHEEFTTHLLSKSHITIDLDGTSLDQGVL